MFYKIIMSIMFYLISYFSIEETSAAFNLEMF